MCGIVGIVARSPVAGALEGIQRAMDALRHRGPDAAGLHHDDCAILGHRRLSIIDTQERSNQPMSSAAGESVIAFNGEIYNFIAVRDELSRRGEQFRTSGDTEVLLRLLEREGVAALPRLRGMYAFAFWSPSRRELLLARDPFGEKPLFVSRNGSGIAFASEIRALLELPGVGRRLNDEALGYFLECGFVPPPATMFRDVESLRPGEWLRWQDGVITTGEVGAVNYRPDPALQRLDDAKDALRDALRVAVRRQMVSDVPLGAFLSGGVDSSSIVALAQSESSRPIQTFNVRFEDAAYDESAVARRVADHLGTDHHELSVEDASFRAEDFWRIVDHIGVPFHDSSAIPTYIVSRYARQFVTVALSGDGGDELFGGYPVFRWGATVNRLARLPRRVARLGRTASELLGRTSAFAGSTTVRQARKAFALAALPTEMQRFRAVHWLFSPKEISDLLVPGLRPAVLARPTNLLTVLPATAVQWTPLRRMMYSRLRQELAADMLVKVDRMSMAASLEVRAPFLDPDLAELSLRMPDEHLIQGSVGKVVLREAMRPFLPPEVFSHPKWGFAIPLHRFLNQEFRDFASDLLSPTGPIAGVLQPDVVQRVLARGLARTADRADVSVYQATHQLWAVMQLAAWIARFGVTL